MDKQEAKELAKALSSLDKTLNSINKSIDLHNRYLGKQNELMQSMIDKMGTLSQILQNR